MASPRVSVIIVNFNSGARLAKCLDHLAAQVVADFETIIIDNASTDDSLEATRVHSLAPMIVEAKENLGFAKANNRAADLARGEWLAFLNPDAYAEPDWLENMLAAIRANPDADAFGSKQIDALNPEKADGLGDVCHALGLVYRGGFGASPDSVTRDGLCFSPCAAAAFYRRETYLALGGFDESFFCYGEDVDLGFRLRLQGGHCVQVADAIVRHEGSGVTGRYSDFSVYHGNRNRIWLYYKNLPLTLLIFLSPLHLVVNSAIVLRAFAAGYGGAYWRGLWDGYLGTATLGPTRRDIQKARKASIWSIAKALTWSPFKMLRRGEDLRAIEP